MPVEFVDLEEAKARDGLRMVFVPGVPSPWSEAAKGILHVKDIPYVAVRLQPGDNPVTAWTGESSAPVALYEDEAPRGGWAGILLLAERLRPEPALIPELPANRALLFGLSHEICGEMGLGWCRRLERVAAVLEPEGEEDAAGGYPRPIAEYLGRKYGYRPGCGREARERVIAVLTLLAARLADQAMNGSDYLIGGSLTAADIYSATFMGLFEPLPPEQCPIPEALRPAFTSMHPDVAKAVDPLLLAHRDRIYQQHLELPLTL